LEIVFGWDLDGLTYPDTATGASASFNSLVSGPSGLLALLETRLGLRRKLVQRAHRVAQYLACLSKQCNGEQFYSASLASDAWATADHLLSIRDELIASGWNKQPIDGLDKIAALADVETRGTISDGFAERLRDVNDMLKAMSKRLTANRLIDRVRIVGPLSTLPPIRRETLALLAQSGTKVEELIGSPKSQRGDLQTLQQQLLTGEGTAGLRGDGSVCIMDADDEVQAATVTAAWLAQRQKRSDIVLVRSADCSLLDQACKRYGLSLPGNTARSQFRAVCQVLPLAFEMSCRPIDPKKMVEFLTIQGGPIPVWIARRLVDALGDAPGFGSKEWYAAWEKCIDMQLRWIQNDEPALSTGEARNQSILKIKEWQNWFAESNGASTQANTQMTQQEAESICHRVEQWALSRASGNEHQDLYLVLAGQSKMLKQLISLCGCATISLIQLRKMIKAVGTYGSSTPTAEAAEWSLVDQPGQVWDSAPTVVWWGFAQPLRSIEPTSMWSEQEVALLELHRIFLERPIDKLRRQSYSSRLAVLNATERLILVKPRAVGGQPAMLHPLWDEIASVLDKASIEAVTVPASDAFFKPAIKLANTTISSERRDSITLPGALRTWRVSPNIIKGRTRESYSSIDKALGCSLAWVLQYGCGMYPPKALNLPEKQLLLGKLAHKVVKELFDERKVWTPEQARERARAIVPRLLPQIAAGLLLPGATPQLREATQAIPESMFQLTKFLRDAGVAVEGCEQSLSAPINANTVLGGQVDMLVRLPSGSRAVLDFKWSSAPYWYRKRLIDGKALQLAIYSWLAKQTEQIEIGKDGAATVGRVGGKVGSKSDSGVADKGDSDIDSPVASEDDRDSDINTDQKADQLPPAGFFMFRHGELFFTADGIFPGFTLVRKMARSLDETWTIAIESYERTLVRLKNGTAIASGISDQTVALDDFMNPVLVDPPCDFCQLGHFCGKKELV
jgi:hypothetical protein